MNGCSNALDSSIPLWVILAHASSWAELQLFSIVWNLAIRTPLRGPSTARPCWNRYTNSQQAKPFPMIMNRSVLHVSIHLSDRLWRLMKPQQWVLVWHQWNFSISRCIGSPRYRGLKELLVATPYHTCRHGHSNKGLNWTEMPMQHRGDWGMGLKKRGKQACQQKGLSN